MDSCANYGQDEKEGDDAGGDVASGHRLGNEVESCVEARKDDGGRYACHIVVIIGKKSRNSSLY